MKRENHRYVFFGTLPSGNRARLTTAIPRVGQPERFWVHWERPFDPLDAAAYEQWKEKICSELSRISGRRHWLEEEKPEGVAA
jgi:hypothetical protein